jgi:hypothetical protein
VALLGVLGIAAGFALAASGPPAPTIVSGPQNPTNTTSASFGYSDSQSVTFQCSLDGSSVVTCGSGQSGSITYNGPLSQGSHTFQVQAASGNKTSSATAYTWTVDTTRPTVSSINLASANPTNAASVQWTVTFSKSVTGVATSNFSLVASGLSGSPAITGVTGSGATYTVSASTGTGTTAATGTLQLQLSSAGSIKDLAGNLLSGPFPVNGQTYTIDKTPPPPPQIGTHPPSLTNSTTATFSFSDTESGTRFLCKLDTGAYAACTSPTSYSVSQGTHTFSVEAQDAAGNVSSATSFSWTVDTTPPPNPTITSGPSNPTNDTSATFTFADSEAPVTFQCKLDSGAWTACTSPVTYTGLSANNTHEFSVRAVDAAGNVSGETDFQWKISASANFAITGNASGTLYPGGITRLIPLTLTNPDDSTLYVTALSASVDATKLPSGCLSGWFSFVQSNVSSTNTVTISQHGSVTLPTGSVTTPTITLIDKPVNQDACKNATVSLVFTGSAHS